MTAKALPSSLTSYDFLKFAALILMIVDHVGYFFYPDDLWLRAIGRLSAPIWFFLIGFARSRDTGFKIWAGMFILLGVNLVVGQPLLPLNILATMIVFRLLLDPVMTCVRGRPQFLYLACFITAGLGLVTFPLIDYGAEGFLFVMFGYVMRHKGGDAFSAKTCFAMALTAGIIHTGFQVLAFFNFDSPQKIFVIAGILVETAVLYRFRPYEYPGLTRSMTKPAAWIIQLCGRHSLELYVLHLVAFKFLALYWGLEGYRFMDFHIINW